MSAARLAYLPQVSRAEERVRGPPDALAVVSGQEWKWRRRARMAAKEKAKEIDLVDLLEKANAGTLAVIDEKIATKTAERDAATKKLDGELAALAVLRKAVNAMVHGKPERKKREPRESKSVAKAANKASSEDEDRQRIHDWLANQDDPCKPGVIGAALDIHAVRVASLMRGHEWFREGIGGFEIA